MTIGETREQISTLETELAQLKNEKHQLFVQLKKVLHEDDNRRRLIKETKYEAKQFCKSKLVQRHMIKLWIFLLVFLQNKSSMLVDIWIQMQ